mmetsp:Transcript_11356/g.34973  ORF Transcript_11356/g.34973 Transcript_11356/m.34973 type:complete len:225 (-) Transcript_11356:286-960(-)
MCARLAPARVRAVFTKTHTLQRAAGNPQCSRCGRHTPRLPCRPGSASRRQRSTNLQRNPSSTGRRRGTGRAAWRSPPSCSRENPCVQDTGYCGRDLYTRSLFLRNPPGIFHRYRRLDSGPRAGCSRPRGHKRPPARRRDKRPCSMASTQLPWSPFGRRRDLRPAAFCSPKLCDTHFRNPRGSPSSRGGRQRATTRTRSARRGRTLARRRQRPWEQSPGTTWGAR